MRKATSKRTFALLLAAAVVLHGASAVTAAVKTGGQDKSDVLVDESLYGADGEDASCRLSEDGETLYVKGTGSIEADWIREYLDDDVKSVIIEKGITAIGKKAFLGYDIETVQIPTGLNTIGDYAFDGCTSLTKVTISDDNGTDEEINSETSGGEGKEIRSIFKAAGVSTRATTDMIGKFAFSECSFREFIIPDGVKVIEKSAFADCKELESITIPGSLTSIDDGAFMGCNSMKNVEVPDTVKNIGDMAFGYDSDGELMEGFTIECNKESAAYKYSVDAGIIEDPDDETNPPEDPDNNKPGNNPGNNPSMTPGESDKFDLTDEKTRSGIHYTEAKYTGEEICPTVWVMYRNVNLIEDEDYDVTYLNNINCGTATAIITGKGSYQGTITYEFKITMTLNKTFTVGKYKYKVTNSTSATFMGLKNKDTPAVVIPSKVKIGGLNYKVTAINSKALRNNKKMTSLIIGSNVKTIGQSAFEGCTKLETLEIGKNVTTIGVRAFYKCSSLTDITIPSKVSKIGKQAFFNCKNVTDIIVETKKLTSSKIGSKAFKGTSPEVEVEVPKKKLAAYTSLFRSKGVHANATYTT